MDSEKVDPLPTYDGHTGRANTFVRPQDRRLHDPDVPFEEYAHYAKKTRAEEDARAPLPTKDTFRQIFSRSKAIDPTGGDEVAPPVDKRTRSVDVNLSDRTNRLDITDEEWTNAARMLRTATWGACFYLITTDILGPYGVGFAMGTLGWGPGKLLDSVLDA